MKPIIVKFLIVISIITSINVLAWGLTGHRVIAEIAQQHLNSRTERKIKRLIGHQKLAYYANWPDFIKSDTTGVWNQTSSWHYVNINSQKNYQQFKKSLEAQKSPNLFTQIKKLSEEIKNKNTSDYDKKIALIFLIHLVGDLHQPLHVGRSEDMGGNKINISYFGQNTNLHSLWDSKIVDDQKYSYKEFANLLDIKPKKEVIEIQKGSLEEWLYDSHKMANSIYFHTPQDSKLSYSYNYRFQPIVERQLLYGGLRLAHILNDVFS